MERLKTGILISGRGSNMRALINASRQSTFPAEIVIVLSNQADAPGLQFARESGISTEVISHKDKTRPVFEQAVHSTLIERGVQFICLAGFMRILTADFLRLWPDRVLNIHPSLLPAFPGLHPQAQALAAGVKFSGCTVHFVTSELDAGPIVAQAVVPVRSGDDIDILSARILAAEHKLYPAALCGIAERQFGKANKSPASDSRSMPPETALFNPPI